jgi:hypothetical protein
MHARVGQLRLQLAWLPAPTRATENAFSTVYGSLNLRQW